MKHDDEERAELSLTDAIEYLLQECRMVLPGEQALLGFQLVAVFNNGFVKLSGFEQRLHLVATILVAGAVVLTMTPAAYHLCGNPREVRESFLTIASRFVVWSMWSLAFGISLEFFLIARIILNGAVVPLLAAALFVGIVTCWFVLPRVEYGRRTRARRG